MLTYKLLLKAAREVIRLKNIGHFGYVSRQSETAMFELDQIVNRIDEDQKDFRQLYDDGKWEDSVSVKDRESPA